MMLVVSAIISFLTLVIAIHFIDERTSYIIKNDKFTAFTRLTLIILLCIFTIGSVFYAGQRSLSWFIMQTVCTGINIVLMLTKKVKSLDVLVAPLLITALTSIAIMSAQGTPIIGSDQWRDFVAAQTIIMDGNYWRASAFLPVYNKPAPIMEMLTAILSTVTGSTLFYSYSILTIIFPILAVLALYIAVYDVVKDRVALVAASLLVLSNPMIFLWMVVHNVFASLLSLLFFGTFLRSYRSLDLPMPGRFCTPLLLATAVIMQHASPVVGIILLIIATISSTIIKVIRREAKKSALYSLLRFLLIIVIIMLIYWVCTIIFEWIIRFQVRFVRKVSFHPVTSPMPALQAKNVMVALSYSIPVAFASAYVYRCLLLNVLVRSKEESVNMIFAFSAIMGGALLFLGFLIFYTYGAWSDTRYLGTPGYLLLLIPAAICFSLLIRRGRGWVKVLAISLSLIMLYSGSISAGWAPDQYNTTTTRFHDIHSQNVALTLVELIPDSSTVTAVRGVDDPFYCVSALYGKSFNVDQEFLHLLYYKKGSELRPEEVIKFVRFDQLLILDAETIQPFLAYYPNININVYYTSGQYFVLSR